jgi:ubiquinol-cytochrome c reductase cytochrome c1 subunit
MVRFIGGLVGIVFVVTLLWAAVAPREAVVEDPSYKLHLHPIDVKFQQDGPLGMGVFGTFDRAQLQRGFLVYKEVCSACHGLERLAFRNLADIGFSEPEVKALAKQWEVPAIDEKTGEPTTRPAIPSDYFPAPYPNEVAARAANNNALPPDLSLITKAREGGADYLYSLLVGYKNPPAGHEVPEGLYFNPYFANLNIAMPPPITSAGQVTYAEGQPEPTVDQMSKDVTAFLEWAAEPKAEARKRTGVAVMIFLLILTALSYLTYRKVWADVKKGTGAERNLA